MLENNAEVSLLDAYKASKTRAESKACCDYAFHVCMRHFDERASVDMGVLANEHGVNSFKLYMNEASDAELIGFFKRCKELGALALVHAENGALIEEATKRVQALGITGPEAHLLSRPESAELEAVSRAIHTAHQLNCPLYVCSVSSRLAARQIADARRRRCSIVFAETLAACLGTDGTHYYNTCWRHAAGHVCSPPLRDEAATSGALADALANGDLDSVSSHHCTFNTNQKALGKDDWTLIPSGVNGLEERLAVTWDRGVASGKMSASQFVAATSTNAARVFNMYPRKGHIAEGSDADLVVWDPLAQRLISVETHRQAVDFNVFEGMRCVGVATHVIANGNLVLENGTVSELLEIFSAILVFLLLLSGAITRCVCFILSFLLAKRDKGLWSVCGDALLWRTHLQPCHDKRHRKLLFILIYFDCLFNSLFNSLLSGLVDVECFRSNRDKSFVSRTRAPSSI